MKQSFVLLAFLLSLPAHSASVKEIDKTKINGPQCLKYLNRTFKIKVSDAYQICSMKSEETKICFIQNNSLSKNEIANICIKK